MNETNSPNIVQTDDPKGCGIPDAKANDENDSLECHNSVISYEEAKDYLLSHRPIALPERFLRGYFYKQLRIERVAAHFIYRPSFYWRGPLSTWHRDLLTRCFDLEIVEISHEKFCAKGTRKTIPDSALDQAEILEELWQYEHETATELAEAIELYKQGRNLGLPEAFGHAVEDLKRKKEALTQRLCAILAHQWMLIHEITWPSHIPGARMLVCARYRDYSAPYAKIIKLLCKVYDVPRRILEKRMLEALTAYTGGNRWSFPQSLLREFSVKEEA